MMTGRPGSCGTPTDAVPHWPHLMLSTSALKTSDAADHRLAFRRLVVVREERSRHGHSPSSLGRRRSQRVSWLDPVEKEAMQAKLALLVAAAVIFAPGWQASDAVTGRPAGAELAGRILAPTFDEANAASQVHRGAYKRLERPKPRGVSSKVFAWPTAACELPPLGHLWMAAPLALLLPAVGGALSTRSPRAPPPHLTV
jgi:hypothetical protein